MQCVSCKSETETVFGSSYKNQIDDGLYFEIPGGYGMFFDSISSEENKLFDEPMKVLLCHNCSVKVMEIVDPEVKKWGGHPTLLENNKRCCKWCWTQKDIQNKTNERED